MPIDHCLSGLKPIREAKRVRASELAERLGVTLVSYYRYERGDARIQFDRVCVLADYLQCTTDDLRRATEQTVTVEPEPQPDLIEEGWVVE